MPKPAKATLKQIRWEITATAKLTKGFAGDAVTTAASKKASHPVGVTDFEMSEVLSMQRPCLSAVDQYSPDKEIVYTTLGLERNLSSVPQCRFQEGQSGCARIFRGCGT